MRTQFLTLNWPNTPVYLISDIHANLPALMAVLQIIPKDCLVICAGDIVGYYINPNEVCSILRDRDVLCIQGNHDKYVLGTLNYSPDRDQKYRTELTRQVLSQDNKDWIASLPDLLHIQFRTDPLDIFSAAVSIHVAHGTPTDIEEYVYPDTPIDFLSTEDSDVLVLGHTHHPMLRHAGEISVVNPGSVGQPRDRIQTASIASIDLASMKIQFCRVPYCVDKYEQSLRSAGVHPSMIEILSRSK